MRARDDSAVKVCRARDEGVSRQDEQQQARRRARPHKSLPPSDQAFAQVVCCTRERIFATNYSIADVFDEAGAPFLCPAGAV
jgi:hypothetical protein